MGTGCPQVSQFVITQRVHIADHMLDGVAKKMRDPRASIGSDNQRIIRVGQSLTDHRPVAHFSIRKNQCTLQKTSDSVC